MADLPVTVIGAGIGGLSAAIRLAVAGESVIVLEKEPDTGGKMSQVEQDGFRWDTGPSVITMRDVLEELFACAGRKLEDYLDLVRVDPVTRYFWRDGTVLDARADVADMARQIGRIEPRDVEGYLEFLAYAARLYRLTGPAFIYGPPPGLHTIGSVSPREALRIDPWSTMDRAIRRHVRSPHLRQFLGRFATYVGASPFLTPATLNVIAHVEMTGGVWYPRGGIYAIAAALTRLAEELGVEVRRNTPVERILIQGGRASGVELADGTQVPSRAVVANTDVTATYTKLLPGNGALAERRQRLTRAPVSCSGFVMLLGIDGKHDELCHHNIFFSGDYRREFDEIFDSGRPPSEPTVYVAVTAKNDPDHAPAGCENWFVLVNAPALDERWNWKARGEAYAEVVLDTLAGHGLDVRERIRTRMILTPEDLQQRTGAWRGALYGTSSNRMLDAFRRPHNRCPDIAGLYFAGGTAHPGGGVPMVTLSGKQAAQMLLDDLA